MTKLSVGRVEQRVAIEITCDILSGPANPRCVFSRNRSPRSASLSASAQGVGGGRAYNSTARLDFSSSSGAAAPEKRVDRDAQRHEHPGLQTAETLLFHDALEAAHYAEVGRADLELRPRLDQHTRAAGRFNGTRRGTRMTSEHQGDASAAAVAGAVCAVRTERVERQHFRNAGDGARDEVHRERQRCPRQRRSAEGAERRVWAGVRLCSCFTAAGWAVGSNGKEKRNYREFRDRAALISRDVRVAAAAAADNDNDARRGLHALARAHGSDPPASAPAEEAPPCVETLCAQNARCERWKVHMHSSPLVVFLRKHLALTGCAVSNPHILCAPCDAARAGGFGPPTGTILLCQNRFMSKKHMEDTLAHELIHMFDHCRFKMYWYNLRHVACSEIRAASLSGDCRFGREIDRGNFRITKQHQACVRRRALLSLKGHPNCPDDATAERALNEVWESCFADTRPFDQIY